MKQIQAKIKFFKFFKFEEFTINFNFSSISIKSFFESIIKSDVDFVKTEENSIVTQEIMKQEIMNVVVVVVIETAKLDVCFKDIDFFDFIMQVDF